MVPSVPPAPVERQVTEWQDRADLHQHAFNGEWHVLAEYGKYLLLERWVAPPDDLEGAPIESKIEHMLKVRR